jgi:tetratricopeptide (TPR) repeat protein
MMNEIDAQRFNDVRSKYEDGNYSQALEELRELASEIIDPWDKAELLYNEIIFLVVMRKIPEARQRVSDLNRAIASLIEVTSDGYEYDLPISLPVMARQAELRVTAAEGKTLEALRILDDLVSRYPKQLSIPEFQTVSQEIKTLRGILLADAGRWEEAGPFLEDAVPPDCWRGTHTYYLGQYYYELKKYERAKEKLLQALNLDLPSSWEGQAHFILGSIEYSLSDLKAAKRHLEECARTADPKYLDMAKVWWGLEVICRNLGLLAEAENYQKLRTGLPPKSKIN